MRMALNPNLPCNPAFRSSVLQRQKLCCEDGYASVVQIETVKVEPQLTHLSVFMFRAIAVDFMGNLLFVCADVVTGREFYTSFILIYAINLVSDDLELESSCSQ